MADVFAIQTDPIEVEDLSQGVAARASGAVATFSGVVRSTFEGRPVRHLEYEAFEPMAVKVLGEIGTELRERYELSGIAIVHRVGRLEVGEVSVAIAVSAPHRRAALDACAEAIELVKSRLPVWKKEFFEGGEVWRENDPRAPASSCR